MNKEVIRELIELLKQKDMSKEKLSKLKLKLCRKYKVRQPPTDIEILLHATPEDIQEMKLVVKPMRTQSGVAVVAIMSYPFACKHGRCLYCPGGPSSFFGDVPQSYTGKEPATMRAIRNKYDAYLQVFNRLEQYIALGHMPDKIELIIMGGTFPSFEREYQEEFIAYALKAMNDFGAEFFVDGELDFAAYKKFFEMPGDMRDDARIKRIQARMIKLKGKFDLLKEQKRNETSKIRCVAMCLETRPDYCFEKEVNEMLTLGGTRVELGVQTVYEDVMKKIKRGHSVKDAVKATQLMKDSFLKVGYHMMPGLPGSDSSKDIKMFKELFDNPDFMPDALKIYPCMVIEGTELYDMWKKKKYSPITTAKAAKILVEAKKFIPKYCRVMRVQRDIPTTMISAGVDRTNLRQYVSQLLKEKDIKCKCIRCREPKGRQIDFSKVEIKRMDYSASKGKEVFLSAEVGDILLGFCRLRIPFKPFRPEITKTSAGIRELHVYGTAVPVGEKGMALQHKGLGKKLMLEAERIAKEEFKCDKMLVISGIGVREYYKKLGYKKDGVYVSKKL
ncbi:tRNA uridine(34) 5-carboxymethylaminomethyl modification radical SAM/GNAT enzyme Elp3 [Candidatus Woesearchaeota archaeon]|nr:tRNA uridine(34) 5-carboxymethylaminomethyl modification radical SAM/GNAT enzyme Elp3 [Candidatus Woesearchaeota archaeon]MBW2994327.1 tRNA uridine(34) 5-carboxymethylaminomethyl modification radical SAM/GNAT enzyme Elp3 [Candidatus Woesearchaeota archaeon]